MATIDKSSDQRVPLESLVSEADSRFREGIHQLTDWSQQARKVLDERPGAALVGVAAAGFVAGMILRGSPELGSSKKIGAEPLLAFFGAALAGYFLGEKVQDFSVGSPSYSGSRVTSLERH